MMNQTSTPTVIYKLLSRNEWREAKAAGVYVGSADDLRDGFIHFSTAEQVKATFAKYFSKRAEILLAEISVDALTAAHLKWEPSRGGDLFPHLYSDLALKAVTGIWSVAESPNDPPKWPDHIAGLA
ncbi:MAG: DUF952 domain-containing protein [Pseudomonadota bacterium]